MEETDPAGLVLLHALGGSQNLTKTVLIHGDRHQNSYIFVLSTPVAAQVDAVHIDVWIPSALQGAVAPILDVNVGFLVQLDDGGFEGYALEPRHVERNVTGGRGKVPVVVTAAVALTGLAALVARRLRQGLRLLLQQFVQGFFYTSSN